MLAIINPLKRKRIKVDKWGTPKRYLKNMYNVSERNYRILFDQFRNIFSSDLMWLQLQISLIFSEFDPNNNAKHRMPKTERKKDRKTEK